MSRKILVMLFLTVVFFSGCLKNKEGAPTPIPQDEAYELPCVKLERLGFACYGVDERRDAVLGDMMLLGMNVSQNASEVNRQVHEGFKAIYGQNPSKDFYLIELDGEVGVLFFGSKGDDLRAFFRNEINESEWSKKNKETMQEFYERINPLLNPEDAQAISF